MSIRALVHLMMALAVLAPAVADAKRPTLNVIEKRQLPQHCWGSRHGDPQKYGALPQYNIPRVCGKAMNHLCNGHMYLIAAQRPTEQPREKRFYAQKAVGEFEYTRRHMAPACPLQQEVDGSLALARMLQGRR